MEVVPFQIFEKNPDFSVENERSIVRILPFAHENFSVICKHCVFETWTFIRWILGNSTSIILLTKNFIHSRYIMWHIQEKQKLICSSTNESSLKQNVVLLTLHFYLWDPKLMVGRDRTALIGSRGEEARSCCCCSLTKIRAHHWDWRRLHLPS